SRLPKSRASGCRELPSGQWVELLKRLAVRAFRQLLQGQVNSDVGGHPLRGTMLWATSAHSPARTLCGLLPDRLRQSDVIANLPRRRTSSCHHYQPRIATRPRLSSVSTRPKEISSRFRTPCPPCRPRAARSL